MVAYSFQERFIRPIEVGLMRPSQRLKKDPPPKTQTIRAIGKRRHARPGEVLQLYYGMRTKQCRQIGTGKCRTVEAIYIDLKHHRVQIQTDDGPIIHDSEPMLNAFARMDGFADWVDMVMFWNKTHAVDVFNGLLIQWEPIR